MPVVVYSGRSGMTMSKLIAGAFVLVAVTSASADTTKSPTAPKSLIGTYERVAGEAPHQIDEGKGNSCGDDVSALIQKTVDNVSRVIVVSNSITMNNGKASTITFATKDAVVSNVVTDRDDRFTTALRISVLGSGALVVTRNRVERETADWCSDTWGVLLQRAN